MAKQLAKRQDVGIKPRMPILTDGKGRILTPYESEKRVGLRTQRGERKLKSLTPRHLQIITLHLAGEKTVDIARQMGISPAKASQVIHDPLSQDIIQSAYLDRKAELNALAGRAIDAVRDSLDNSDHKVRLLAVDRFAKLKDSLNPEERERETAEDVIARIKAAIQVNGENVQINFGAQDNGNRAASGDNER